jgi:predicted RNA binding protein YcfA (HicA-like mRNA interferase family)
VSDGYANKRVREFVKRLEVVGWSRAGTSRGTHVVIEHPEFGEFTLPNTPSDVRQERNDFASIARVMGISTKDLRERCFGGPRSTQPIEVRKARRRRGRRGRRLSTTVPGTAVVKVEAHPVLLAGPLRSLADVEAEIDRLSRVRSDLRREPGDVRERVHEIDEAMSELWDQKRRMQARLAA